MKTLQVMAGAAQGGAETAYVDLCIALREAGVDVVAATRRNPARQQRLTAAGIQTYILPFRGMMDVYTPYRLRKIIALEKPQIVQCWMSRAAQKTPGSPVRGHAFKKMCRLGGYYALKHFPHTDHFTTITPMIRDWLMSEGVAANRVTHINNFAEVEPASAEKGAQKQFRANLRTPDDAFVYLALSRLHSSKAIDTLLDAFATTDARAYLWIAGDGPERTRLEHQAERLGIVERVRFLGWRDDRASLLDACDAVVFPSRYEPFGTVFVQAWAAAKPVITSTADGPRQFVRNGEDALVFAIDDTAALSDALKRLKNDAALRAQLVQNGAARYAAEFTKTSTVEAYLRLYEEKIRELNQ